VGHVVCHAFGQIFQLAEQFLRGEMALIRRGAGLTSGDCYCSENGRHRLRPESDLGDAPDDLFGDGTLIFPSRDDEHRDGTELYDVCCDCLDGFHGA
jgi:hypothetical protein